jgi:hypothetical protein
MIFIMLRVAILRQPVACLGIVGYDVKFNVMMFWNVMLFSLFYHNINRV